jgi:hypothetical protein
MWRRSSLSNRHSPPFTVAAVGLSHAWADPSRRAALAGRPVLAACARKRMTTVSGRSGIQSLPSDGGQRAAWHLGDLGSTPVMPGQRTRCKHQGDADTAAAAVVGPLIAPTRCTTVSGACVLWQDGVSCDSERVPLPACAALVHAAQCGTGVYRGVLTEERRWWWVAQRLHRHLHLKSSCITYAVYSP